MTDTILPEEIHIWEYDRREKEPGIPMHDIFQSPILFDISFLQALISD